MTMRHIDDNEIIAPGFIDKLLEDHARLEEILSCPACRENLQTYAEYLRSAQDGFPEVTEQEKIRIRHQLRDPVFGLKAASIDFQWRCISRLLFCTAEVLAVADGQNADRQLQESAQNSGYLLFKAQCDAGDPLYWRARIIIPTRPTADTVLRIHLINGSGDAIRDGVFLLCGLRLPVKDGRAFVKLTEFQQRLNTPMAALEYAGNVRQDGVPVFFDPENW